MTHTDRLKESISMPNARKTQTVCQQKRHPQATDPADGHLCNSRAAVQLTSRQSLRSANADIANADIASPFARQSRPRRGSLFRTPRQQRNSRARPHFRRRCTFINNAKTPFRRWLKRLNRKAQRGVSPGARFASIVLLKAPNKPAHNETRGHRMRTAENAIATDRNG